MQNDQDMKENQTAPPCYHQLAPISTYAVAKGLVQFALQA